MKKTYSILGLVAAAALAACSSEPRVAVNTTAPAPAPVAVAVVPAPAPTTITVMGAPGPFTAADRDFALNASGGNLFEIGATQLAAKRTDTPDVLALASTINQHHTMAQNELAAIMRAHGIASPGPLPPERQRVLDKLGTAHGDQFDRYFLVDVGIQGHQADIANFQRQMPALSDPDLRAWAQRTLPLMQQHLDMAQRVAARFG